MSLIFADSFDVYGVGPTNATMMLQGPYAQVDNASGNPGIGSTTSILADPDGSSTQSVLRIGANDLVVRKVLPSTQAIIGVCARIWLPNLPASVLQRPRIEVRSNNNVTLATVEVTPSGRLKFSGGGEGGEETVNPVITAEGWWHIEFKIDSTADTFELRVEGVEKMSLSGLAFSPDFGQVALCNSDDSIGGGVQFFIKDFVIWDGLGTMNNDFLGAVRVLNLKPNADVTLGDWSPSTGTEAYPILDNNPPSDAVYLSAPIGGDDYMQVELENLPPDISSIRGLVTYVRAGKVDGGDGWMEVSMVSNAAVSNGTDRPITAAQLYWNDVFEVDPDTAGPWSPGAVDLAQLRVDRTI